ncbi:carboxypeptidase-like protein [Chitinophaga polysaccharea]|uniref:Carboxypeptidase-like protein n=1 Tax=Chitinophaga polysaccharea TaxID=1293035 RepID=A0A561PRC9_9BACT|nr:carboxypeptidase-like regulatory domain-containing protein [Chitinophaga polysaccharea]TWF40675.1 carboxypeptidase-like protein [Chitinophaga polysaccharea]
MLSALRSFSVLVVVLLSASACLAQKKNEYGSLFYNGKDCSQLIIDRIPDYGIAGRDGCVIQRPVKLTLKDIGGQKAAGIVTDAETNEILPGARVRLKRKDGINETIDADAQGRFELNTAAALKELQVYYVGYRTLKVKGATGQLF